MFSSSAAVRALLLFLVVIFECAPPRMWFLSWKLSTSWECLHLLLLSLSLWDSIHDWLPAGCTWKTHACTVPKDCHWCIALFGFRQLVLCCFSSSLVFAISTALSSGTVVLLDVPPCWNNQHPFVCLLFFPGENAEELLSWLGGRSFCGCLVSSCDDPSCVAQCTWPEFTPTELALWQHNRSPAGQSRLCFYSMCVSPFTSNTTGE